MTAIALGSMSRMLSAPFFLISRKTLRRSLSVTEENNTLRSCQRFFMALM